MDRRQRRIKQLVEDVPAILKAAEETEAAAAAAAKASQTELPSPEKVLPLLLSLVTPADAPSGNTTSSASLDSVIHWSP